MLSLLRSLFNQNKPASVGLCVTASISNSVIPDQYLRQYLELTIAASPAVKPTMRQSAVEHFFENNLLDTGNFLSPEEKRALGLNSRLKVTQEFVALFNEDYLKRENPKHLMKLIHAEAIGRSARRANVEWMQRAGFRRFELTLANTGNECSWCLSQANQSYASNIDVDQLVQDNCTCVPYCFLSVNQAE